MKQPERIAQPIITPAADRPWRAGKSSDLTVTPKDRSSSPNSAVLTNLHAALTK